MVSGVQRFLGFAESAKWLNRGRLVTVDREGSPDRRIRPEAAPAPGLPPFLPDHPAQRGGNIATERNHFDFDINSAITLLKPGETVQAPNQACSAIFRQNVLRGSVVIGDLPKTALDSDYEASYIRVDEHRCYSISDTTRIQWHRPITAKRK